MNIINLSLNFLLTILNVITISYTFDTNIIIKLGSVSSNDTSQNNNPNNNNGNNQNNDIDNGFKVLNKEILMDVHETNQENTLCWDFENEDKETWNRINLQEDRIINLRIYKNKNIIQLQKKQGKLTTIKRFQLYLNDFKTFSNENTNPSDSKALWSYNNKLTSLLTIMSNLTDLEQLILLNNNLASISKKICEFPKLDDLQIDKGMAHDQRKV